MAPVSDGRGYECITPGCPSHGKSFVGANWCQKSRKHSNSVKHKRALAGEVPDVLEGLRDVKDKETGTLSYQCQVCPKRTLLISDQLHIRRILCNHTVTIPRLQWAASPR